MRLTASQSLIKRSLLLMVGLEIAFKSNNCGQQHAELLELIRLFYSFWSMKLKHKTFQLISLWNLQHRAKNYYIVFLG